MRIHYVVTKVHKKPLTIHSTSVTPCTTFLLEPEQGEIEVGARHKDERDRLFARHRLQLKTQLPIFLGSREFDNLPSLPFGTAERHMNRVVSIRSPAVDHQLA